MSHPKPAVVRAWAVDQGYPVSAGGGPIPGYVWTAWELRDVGVCIPQRRHTEAAHRIVNASRHYGSPAVLEAAEDLPMIDVPLVFVALARLLRDHVTEDLTPVDSDYTEASAREAHRLFRKGEQSPWIMEGERVYQRRNKREKRSAKAAA